MNVDNFEVPTLLGVGIFFMGDPSCAKRGLISSNRGLSDSNGELSSSNY